jgi:hypothetical protein
MVIIEDGVVQLKTRGRAIEGGADTKVPDNVCQLDWKTGKYWIYCGDNWYELPLTTQKLDLDKN